MSILPTFKAPKFTLKLPVSGKEFKARPFLIKEQKILLQAMEVGDADQVTNALDDIMESCTFGEVDIDSLPVPDVEYLMLHLRSKSVGEQIKLSYTCKNDVVEGGEEDKNVSGSLPSIKPITVICNTKLPVVISIDSIKVDINKDRKFKLFFGEDIGIQLRDIPYGEYKKLSQLPESVDKVMKMRNACIESVFDADTVWTKDQFTDEDLNEFVDGLYSNDYEQIEEFIQSMPVLKHDITLVCPKCKHKETITLSGLDDFLA